MAAQFPLSVLVEQLRAPTSVHPDPQQGRGHCRCRRHPTRFQSADSSTQSHGAECPSQWHPSGHRRRSPRWRFRCPTLVCAIPRDQPRESRSCASAASIEIAEYATMQTMRQARIISKGVRERGVRWGDFQPNTNYFGRITRHRSPSHSHVSSVESPSPP